MEQKINEELHFLQGSSWIVDATSLLSVFETAFSIEEKSLHPQRLLRAEKRREQIRHKPQHTRIHSKSDRNFAQSDTTHGLGTTGAINATKQLNRNRFTFCTL